MQIIHHGAYSGVTGSCHELRVGNYGLLVDCGIFQGEEAARSLDIDFPISHIRALLLTHCHIDHIGRIPWLLAAGFRGHIYATEATAALLPLMLDDSLKIQLNLNQEQRAQFINLVSSLLRPVPFDCRASITFPDGEKLTAVFRQAGHILGSAYIEMTLPDGHVVVFSGDLGPSNTPLLVDPCPPNRADTLVLETTYGNRRHDRIQDRSNRLAAVIERSLKDGGAIIIPAFSVGRTQELLFDIEAILSELTQHQKANGLPPVDWSRLPVILDSPLADKVTEQYTLFQRLWAKEAKEKVMLGRHPMSFRQFVTIDSHDEHEALVNRLKQSGEPAIVIAASGMCTGGRVVNYLDALLPDSRTDVVLVGYQAKGTLGKTLLSGVESVEINKQLVPVNASVHELSGYSAHADQKDLLMFVTAMETPPSVIRLVHGDADAQHALADELRPLLPGCDIIITADTTEKASHTSVIS
ncbi:MBL fold metallo-hydrolase RNA specificity domain-containing protein [Photobacterium sp. GSS17]|uniref:MBL fold metallo-hydrolase RNA specificity domain-containing protein n=1 Tax=Photobacterium TaxID=657 RepID=UPI002362257A|nr:MBL fold metallo-hydrolase [Photobacterium sp. GSS17]